MSDNGLFKRITFRSSAAGTPETEYFDPEATVQDILDRFSVSASKTDVTVNGESVELDFVPQSGAIVVITPKKYSSGSDD